MFHCLHLSHFLARNNGNTEGTKNHIEYSWSLWLVLSLLGLQREFHWHYSILSLGFPRLEKKKKTATFLLLYSKIAGKKCTTTSKSPVQFPNHNHFYVDHLLASALPLLPSPWCWWVRDQGSEREEGIRIADKTLGWLWYHSSITRGI